MQVIAKSVESAIARPDVVGASARYAPFVTHSRSEIGHHLREGNMKLLGCISPEIAGETKAPCEITSPEAQLPFDLILPVAKDLESAKSIAKNTIAGGEFPLHYNLAGQKDCFLLNNLDMNEKDKEAQIQTGHPLDPTCQFKVSAFFWANCPVLDSSSEGKEGRGVTLAKSCPTASSINIRYQIRHIVPESDGSNKIKNKIKKILAPIPLDVVFNADPSYGAITVSVDAIPDLSETELSCPRNESIIALVDGKAKCECLFPFQKIILNGVSLCQAKKKRCAANERYRGVNADGTAICKPVACEIIDTNVGCRHGGWIESVSAFTANAKSALPWSCLGHMCPLGEDGGTCTAVVNCYGNVRCCYEIDPKNI